MLNPEIGVPDRTMGSRIIEMQVVHPVGDEGFHPLLLCPF